LQRTWVRYSILDGEGELRQVEEQQFDIGGLHEGHISTALSRALHMPL